jgi:hypothetical protein
MLVKRKTENLSYQKFKILNVDGLVKSLSARHPGESRGPEHLEITGFRIPQERKSLLFDFLVNV